MKFSLPLGSLVFLGFGLMCAPNFARAQRPLGMDVSGYQPGINWSTVKSSSGLSFVWAKAAEATAAEGYIDPDADFYYNATNAKAVGMLMGYYYYPHPEIDIGVGGADKQAAYFWSIAGPYVKGDGVTMVPMLDFEQDVTSANPAYTQATLSQWANEWCQDIVDYGAYGNAVILKPVIYTFISYANGTGGYGPGMNSTVTQWPLWMANVNFTTAQAQTGGPAATAPWSTWNFWQYNWNGTVAGVSQAVDLDVYNGTSATLQNYVIPVGSASLYYWDPQGTTGGNPYTGSMSGTWEGSDWSSSSGGVAVPVAWPEGQALVFGANTGAGTPAFTVTANSNHSFAGVFDGTLSPKACNVTINGVGVLTLVNGVQGFDVGNSSDGAQASLTVSNVIAGSGEMTPEGNGQIYLSGANTYSGGTCVGWSGANFTGTLNFNNNASFGTGRILLANCAGSTLAVEGSSAVTITNPVTAFVLVNNVNVIGNTAGVTFSGPWNLVGPLTIGSGGSANNLVTISGAIGGAGAYLAKNNPGILALSGNNTYSGATGITSGTLSVTGAGKLGGGSYAAPITNNAIFTYASSSGQTLSGTISGTGVLNQNGSGILVLAGANTYSGGTMINSGGVIQINADSGLGSMSAPVTLNGGCLKNNATAPVIGPNRTITLGASGGYIDAGWGPTNSVTINGQITGSGRLLVDMDGSPVVLASAANNYTGDTIIGTNGPGYYSSGTQAWLKLSGSGVIPGGTGVGNVFIYQAYKGLLDVAGTTQRINGLSGDGTVDNSTGTGMLSVGSNNQSSTFSGVIQNSGGTLTLNKVGSGVFTLTGANTYTGNTTVAGGTLSLAATGSISDTPLLTITAGGTLDVSAIAAYTLAGATTLSASGNANPAMVNGGTSVSLGSRPITLNFDGVHPALTIAEGTLVLNGNPLTINGPVLSAGTYTLIQQTTGNISSSGSFSVSGTAIAAGTAGSVSIVGGNLNLTIRATASFSNLAASQSVTYGVTNITLSGTVSAPGPIYPAIGERVRVNLHGAFTTNLINDATGDFSITCNIGSLPVSGTAYVLLYNYGGNGTLTIANNSATTLTMNPRPVILTGTRVYDGTATAAAGVLSVANKVGSDVVTVASGSANLASANVGTQPITSVGTLALGGAAAGNYTLTGATGSVVITSAQFSITSATIDSTGTNFLITWQSTLGTTYHVIGSTSASAPLNTWTNVGGPITAAGTSTTITNPITSSMNVFSVVSP